jgi:hypothetical protein
MADIERGHHDALSIAGKLGQLRPHQLQATVERERTIENQDGRDVERHILGFEVIEDSVFGRQPIAYMEVGHRF